MRVSIAGEMRCVVLLPNGEVRTDTGYQKNIILDQGLDFFGGNHGSDFNAYCAIGSGNSKPQVSQTKLDSYIKHVSGSDVTIDFSYTDKGDGLYRIWEQKKYRFTGLEDVNISEAGLVSAGSSSSNYYLTTRVLIKDSTGAPTSISVKSGETLDIYYKIHKVISTSDTDFVVNMLDGDGGSVPYNVKVRPARVGTSIWRVSTSARLNPGNYQASATTTEDLTAITTAPRASTIGSTYYNRAYVEGSHKLVVDLKYNLDTYNSGIRTIVGYSSYFYDFQIRYGAVSDDSMIPKTSKHTLVIPLEFSWGRFEGEL